MEGLFTIEWIDEIFSGREGHMCVCADCAVHRGVRARWKIILENTPAKLPEFGGLQRYEEVESERGPYKKLMKYIGSVKMKMSSKG